MHFQQMSYRFRTSLCSVKWYAPFQLSEVSIFSTLREIKLRSTISAKTEAQRTEAATVAYVKVTQRFARLN